MILLIAVAAGIGASLIRSWILHTKLQEIHIKSIWLVLFAFLPQWLAFNFSPTREIIPDSWIPLILLGSQLLLLVFVWQNRDLPGIKVMGLGLLLNFVVIALNHGFMPLSPETAQKLIPAGVTADLAIGERVEYGKDILLQVSDTNLWFLSDIFVLPKWFTNRAAFSLGDIFISVGAFLLLWSLGDSSPIHSLEVENAEDI
ncbi:MAG TPA: hypothetical protein DCK95_11155 [Anaerolineaceae bacterium]|uniref:Putative membrane protein n=1 Tax=Anaerolinea thermophila TaxID=167964 RepID=A0A117LGR4_9CHLR|nr:MAG: putative membrane protein [Anaerolinea thermophila]HAF62865.1 hypothetical protein [Anaerolineaceae bacterium]